MKKSLKTVLALCAIAVLSVSCVVTACGKKSDHYDAITKTLKLTKSFEGKVLESDDGIEEVSLISGTTDGDTTAFRLSEAGGGGTVRVRYQGVDTPESTGGVEKWGKAASIFTDTQLKSATKIVLESATGGIPEKDTQGGRSLCYVWYKTDNADFKCLNLELVENGYSLNKENADNAYYSYFQRAETFAKEKKLHLHNPDLEDPLFDTSVQQMSLRDFSEHPEKYAENMKVHLHAYVLEKLNKSGVTYTIAQYDEETKQVYKFTAYAGYVSADGKLQVGGLYHIVGTLQKFSGNWQIAGLNYDNDYKREGEESEHTWRIQSSYYLMFDPTNEYFTNEQGGANNYGPVTVGTVTRDGSNLTFTGTATNRNDKAGTFTFHVVVPEDYNDEIEEGGTVWIKGCYRFTDGSDELTVVDYDQIYIL